MKLKAMQHRGAKGLVDSIKDFQPRLDNLFNQARLVDQYGKLPKIKEAKHEKPSPDTWVLKDKKRKLMYAVARK